MKRILAATLLLLTVLTGCTGELKERIAALDEKITKLEEQVGKQNESIRSLYVVLAAYQRKDFITGITQLEGNAGYAIHFNSLGDIVIYHGTDANVPRVGIKRNPDDGGYYWTIQYGNGPVDYIINQAGEMVSAIGVVPLLKIEKGKFYITYDSRATWQYLGEADGANGDDIFQKITYNDDYVIFKTAEGEYKIPTNKLIQGLYQNAVAINQNMSALTRVIKDLENKAVCVTSVGDYVVGGEVVGSVIRLSTGDSLVINNYESTGTPYISAEMEEGDTVYYWAIVSPDGSKKWILDAEGNRMAATGEHVEIPTVTPVYDSTDKVFYWNMVAAGDTTLVLDIHGNKVPATSHEGELKIFKSVNNNYRDYLLITLANGSTIQIPKIYSIAFSAEAVSMAVSSQKVVEYHVYGADASMNYNLITQGDLTATRAADTETLGSGKITIKTGSTFSGNGKVILLVTAGNGSTKTMVKSITVALL